MPLHQKNAARGLMGELSGVAGAAPDLEAAAALLEKEWAEIQAGSAAISAAIPQPIHEAINRSIDSHTKTYRYVLPTQLLAKVVNPALDCRAIQATAKLQGAFDARSVCQKVIVPFERKAENVLGGSAEPYANNPMRIPAIVPEARSAQKDKNGFDDLCRVLDYAQGNPA